MPPHCDTLDGPVVAAAKSALETGNVNLILPWVPEKAEAELKKAFEKTLNTRKLGKEAAEVADYCSLKLLFDFTEKGEGASYTGLKPAGLDWGSVVRRAEKALEDGNAEEVIDFLLHVAEEDLRERFNHAIARKQYDVNNVEAAREYVHASLGFVLHSHGLYSFVAGKGEEHGETAKSRHEH